MSSNPIPFFCSNKIKTPTLTIKFIVMIALISIAISFGLNMEVIAFVSNIISNEIPQRIKDLSDIHWKATKP